MQQKRLHFREVFFKYVKLVIDKLIVFAVPAIKLTDFFTDLFKLVFSCNLSHSLESELDDLQVTYQVGIP